jgi:hypothetical protein
MQIKLGGIPSTGAGGERAELNFRDGERTLNCIAY